MALTEVEAHRREVEPGLYASAVPTLAPNVEGPVLVRDADTGEPVALVAEFPAELPPYRSALMHLPTDDTRRAVGIRNKARVFGWAARTPVFQNNVCRACSAARLAPELHLTITAAADALAAQFRERLPEQAAEQEAAAHGAIDAEWMMSAGGWWTSGVVNWWSPLPYHRDGNNLPHVWSAMPVVRRGFRGGHLHVPEYDLVFECRDGQVIYFNGHELLHGVTPMRRVAEGGYRISAVYYTVAKMRNCLSQVAELARARTGRTVSEDTSIERIRARGDL